MSKLQTKFELEKQEKEEAFKQALKKGSQKDKGPKKKPSFELLKHLHYDGHAHRILKGAHEYSPKSYNLGLQVKHLIQHMFVKYRVPDFMYDILLVPQTEKNKIFVDWFFAIAQGESLAKISSFYMTKKEAHAFLSSPYMDSAKPYRAIENNIWWSRCVVAGMTRIEAIRVVDKVFSKINANDVRHDDVIAFYKANIKDMDNNTFDEISDFVVHKITGDQNFSFKGRTLLSVVKLSNEWHIMVQKAKLGHFVTWPALDFPTRYYLRNNVLYEVIELNNNLELMKEGKKMKHCVYSYVNLCINSNTHIFSIRGYQRNSVLIEDVEATPLQAITSHGLELSRSTVEIRNSHIVQHRAEWNSSPLKDHIYVANLWHRDNV